MRLPAPPPARSVWHPKSYFEPSNVPRLNSWNWAGVDEGAIGSFLIKEIRTHVSEPDLCSLERMRFRVLSLLAVF